MKKLNKRVSKRVYPKRACKQCSSEFVPNDARQRYCCEQHRIDYNNDLRRIKDAPLKELTAKMVNNEKILKKFYELLQKHEQEVLGIDFLILDNFEFNVASEVSINKNGNKIEWQFSYGLEGEDPNRRLFKIHKR